MAKPQRQIEELLAVEFPGVDPARFEEWKNAAIRARANRRTAWILYGCLAAALLITGVGALLPGPPLLLTLYLVSRKQARLAEALGISNAVMRARERPMDASIVAESATKVCPQCAELIRVEARLCRFCRHEFSEQEVAEATASATQAAQLRVAAAWSQRIAAGQTKTRTTRTWVAGCAGTLMTAFGGLMTVTMLVAILPDAIRKKPDDVAGAVFGAGLFLVMLAAGVFLLFRAVKLRREGRTSASVTDRRTTG